MKQMWSKEEVAKIIKENTKSYLHYIRVKITDADSQGLWINVSIVSNSDDFLEYIDMRYNPFVTYTLFPSGFEGDPEGTGVVSLFDSINVGDTLEDCVAVGQYGDSSVIYSFDTSDDGAVLLVQYEIYEFGKGQALKTKVVSE